VSEVSCLHVDGNRAWVGVTITFSTDRAYVGEQAVYIFRVNNPEEIYVTSDLSASTCGTEPSPLAFVQVTRGGFRVTSA